jgi:hypothetical protein
MVARRTQKLPIAQREERRRKALLFPGAWVIGMDRIFTHQWDIGLAAEAQNLFDRAKTGKGSFVSFD